MRLAPHLTAAAVVVCATGCTTLATSPSWTGGGLVQTAPEREAREDAEAEKEREGHLQALAMASIDIDLAKLSSS